MIYIYIYICYIYVIYIYIYICILTYDYYIYSYNCIHICIYTYVDTHVSHAQSIYSEGKFLYCDHCQTHRTTQTSDEGTQKR